MKISIIQLDCQGTLSENTKKVLSYLDKAVNFCPDIICFSEMFIAWGPNYETTKMSFDDIRVFAQYAKEHRVNIILGSIPYYEDGKLTNTSFVFDRNGEVIGRYDKQHLFIVNSEKIAVNEGERITPGTTDGIFTIDGIKVGVGICVDVRYPEYFRNLVKQGAEVIFLPSHFRKATGSIAWEVLTKARAIENQVYFCGCDNAGDGIVGKSNVISYDGTVVAQLGEEEGILNAEIDLEPLRQYRAEMPVLKYIK